MKTGLNPPVSWVSRPLHPQNPMHQFSCLLEISPETVHRNPQNKIPLAPVASFKLYKTHPLCEVLMKLPKTVTAQFIPVFVLCFHRIIIKTLLQFSSKYPLLQLNNLGINYKIFLKVL
ncbi:MAG TPA: hypothetical protein V6D27_14535, partial [Vampirovibrionales bacterium]